MDKDGRRAQNIVAMSDYQPDTGYAAIAQVVAYWNAIRKGHGVPNRSDVDPRGIEQALENAFILERVTVGMARLRVAGSHLNALMGNETRGMPITAFFVPAVRRVVAGMLEEVFQRPAQGSFSLNAGGGPFLPPLEGRMVLLPLRSDLGDVSRILGCFVTRGEIGDTPRRFEIASQSVTPIHAANGDVPVPVFLDPAPGFAESATALTGAKPRRVPYLRLVDTDD